MVSVRFIEELSLSALPSLQTLYDDGWVLRFAGGYTRRANSVNPLYPSSQPVEAKIERCTALYHNRGLNAVFKLTPAAEPPELDTLLAQRGCHEDGHTSVQTVDLSQLALTTALTITCQSQVTETWLSSFCRLSALASCHIEPMRRMLSNIVPPLCCASLYQDGETAALGLAVADRGYVGLFDIVTDPRLRNQGLGRRMVLDLLSWGRAQGAQQAFLQVLLTNAPALHLYETIGFREAYQYWYRVRPVS